MKVESRVDPKGSGEAVITNPGPVPLTAYLIQVILEPCSPSERRPAVFRAFDAAVSGNPLAQSESRTENLGSAFCNKDGVSVPARPEFRAAIFQDGSFIGDAQSVNTILNNRRFQLKQIDIVLGRLRAAEAGNTPAGIVGEGLKNAVNDAAIAELALASLKTGILPTISLFERLRARLLTARPAL